MIVLHAHWTRATLHLWGERPPTRSANETGNGKPEGARFQEAQSAEAPGPPLVSFALRTDQLRRILGDVCDTLLVSGSVGSSLILRLPHVGGRLVSPHQPPQSPSDGSFEAETTLIPCRLQTISFGPADAVDLLTASPAPAGGTIRVSASFRFWSLAASLVTELLAKQRYVPAIHDTGKHRYRGYWRAVVDEPETARRLQVLIKSIPPVCLSEDVEVEAEQAAFLVENFFWTTVDALVRRCLQNDELTHALHEETDENAPLQTRWLRSLVHETSELDISPPDEGQEVFHRVSGWLSRLKQPGPQRTFRTCFSLHSPVQTPSSSDGSAGIWNLRLHVQTMDDASQSMDAANLWRQPREDPTVLERPFDDARHQFRADVARAARQFPPLAACAEPEGPFECRLTLEEAYRFLRDAAPVLDAEGFGVWLPKWWQEDSPRVRMHLHIYDADEHESASRSRLGLDTLVQCDWRVALGDDDISPEELKQLAAAKQPLVQSKGKWLEVQPLDVERALSFLEKNQTNKMSVKEALRLSYVADDLETGLLVAGLRATGWIERLLDAAGHDEHIENLTPPPGFQGTLRPYQLRGLNWLNFLMRHGLGACLADDMGLGKTIQLIALWLHERRDGAEPGPTLLIVPMSLVGNWQREIERFAPSLRVMVHHGLDRLTGREFVAGVSNVDVVISTYGLAHRDWEHLNEADWHRVALDEAQNIKNPAAKQSVAIRSLRAPHRVVLTGTPIENRLSELWSILDFLNPGYLRGTNEFRRRFAVPIERYHDADRAHRLRHLIRPFVLRRRKDDPGVCVDLPPKLEMTVFCNLTREQAALYQAVLDEMLGRIDHSGGIQRRGLILAALVKLKQICNHPVQFLSDGTELARRSGKCDRITDMLEEVVAEGDRALVFTQFRVMGNLLEKHLRATLGREVLFLHGGTSREQRQKLVDRFQDEKDDAPIFLLSLKAGGFGLNLTAASHVFHYDRWWNPAVEDQATDRAHRIGQDKQVQVHKFVCIGTVEERIAALLERKRSLAESIVGTGENWLTELSTADLRDLFALSRDAVAEE